MKDSYKVLVNAEAIQADGLTAAEAYKALTEATNIAKKTDAANLDEVNAALAEDAAQVVTLTDNITSTDTIEMKNDGSVLNGNGKTITATVEGSANRGVTAKGGTIKDVTISGETNTEGYGFRAVYASYLTNDLVIEGADLTGAYALNVQGTTASKTLTVKDTVLQGWTSFAGVTGAEFTNVKFHANGDQVTASDGGTVTTNTLRAYANAVLTDCEFYAGYNFSAGAEDLTIELTNCTIGGEAVTAAAFANQFKVDDTLKTCTVVVDGVTVVW